MALLAQTVTDLKNRWSNDALARLTRRETYDSDTAPFNTVDEDVLERAVIAAQLYVQQKFGAVAEGHAAVIEAVPFYLYVPGGAPDSIVAAHTAALDILRPIAMTAASDSVEAGEDGDARRYTGEDYINDLDTQSPSRPRRSSR